MALHLGWGATGVFWSVAMCHSLHALVSVYIFKKGRWKLVKVRANFRLLLHAT
jgi:Na+-driven multidrug efflux pump